MPLKNIFSTNLPAGVRHNLYRLYIIKAAKWFMLIMPIAVPFYEDNGLSLHQVMIVKAVYSVSIVILEIPSGYFADVIGRKNTLIIGSILGTVGFIAYSLSYGFYGFIIAEIVLGAGQSLISGSDSATLYDTLSEYGEEDKYSRYEGRIISLGNFSEAIAGVLGGLLAVLSLRYPYYAQAIVAFAAIPASLGIREPARHVSMAVLRFRDIFEIFRNSLFKDRKLSANILFSSIIGTATLTMAWFIQPLFGTAGIPLALYGILWTLLNIVVAISSLFAYRFEKHLGERKTLIFICVLIPSGFILAALFSEALIILLILFIFYIVRGIATPVLKDYINKLSDSGRRATVLSVRSFIIRINFAIIAPATGWLSDTYTLKTGMIISGTLFLVLSLPLLLNYLYRLRD